MPIESGSSREQGPPSFEDAIRMGTIASLDEARAMQRNATVDIIERKPVNGNSEGFVAQFRQGGTQEFENAADALAWVERTGGLIYNESGELKFGQDADEIWQRLKGESSPLRLEKRDI